MYNPAKSVYFNPNIQYLFNNEIVEYDMKEAGFSIIKAYKLLSGSEIKTLEGISQRERLYAIGMHQKTNRELAKQLSEKFAEIRSVFISANKLSDSQIISVKKDAIYTIGECRYLKFNGIEFIPKHRYSSYLRLATPGQTEFYFNEGKITVKGMGDSAVNRHRLYMMEVVRKFMSEMETKNLSIKRYLKNFVDMYRRKQLDDEYYVEFNLRSRDVDPMQPYKRVLIPMVQIATEELK